MKTPWTVYLEFGRIRPSAALRLRQGEYEKRGVEFVHEADERLCFRVECQGYSVTDAIEAAARLVQDDVACGLLPPPEGISCHRSGGREPIPELLGMSEISGLLKVSRQRVTQLAKQSDFPRPVAKLAMGPVFSGRSVKRFKKDWQRKIGRPRLPSYGKSMASSSSAKWRKVANDSPPSAAAGLTPTSEIPS